MGQIAEDMRNGSCCEICGQYFKHQNDYHFDDLTERDKMVEEVKEKLLPPTIYTHCYPVVCWDCWSGLTKEDKLTCVRADVETF